MKPTESPLLRLPGEEAWELWRRDEKTGWKRADRDDGAKGGIFAVPAIAVDSSPFWLMGGGDTESNMEATAGLRWDALGFDTEGDGQNWLYWRVAEEEGRVLAATMALSPDAQDMPWLEHDPATFELSAMLMPIPSGECAIWKELGRYVLAFSRAEALLHVTLLNSRTLDEAAASEVRDVMHALEVRGFLPKLKACRIWTAPEKDFSNALRSALGESVRVREQIRPAPQLPQEPSGLLPAEIAHQRMEKLQRARLARIIGVVAVAYVAFFGAWAGWLWLRDHRVEGQLAVLAQREPEVNAIRDTQLRWGALEAATDPNQYPFEIYHQIVSLLPPDGIQLQKFSLNPDKITVSGVASSTHHANKFTADVENNESLKRFAWSIQPINIAEDGRASFIAEGVPAGGTVDEQQ